MRVEQNRVGWGLGRFAGLVILLNLLLYHYPLWRYLNQNLDLGTRNGWLTLLSVCSVWLLFNLAMFSALTLLLGRGIKYLVMLLFPLNALALYFVSSYGVILDKSMIGNIFNTNIDEASSYLGWKMVAYVLLLGVLPAWWIVRRQIRQPVRRLPLFSLSVGGIALSVLWLALNAQTWLWIDKHSKYVGGLVMPWSYIVNALRYQADIHHQPAQRKPLPDGRFLRREKTLVVLVIGESARAASFSLYGYKRETNPELSSIPNVWALPNSFSTTTYTTASVLSLLSVDGSTHEEYELLPEFLARQGVGVLWRSNNSGEPEMLLEHYQKAGDLRQACRGEGCAHDEVLLARLKEDIDALNQDRTLVVLHTAGSHGPSYYRKYPSRYSRFTPVCTGVDLDRCGRQSLINAYDNSIVYTDHVLARLIRLLKLDFPETGVMMLYISDHGESLGESGLYLHGTPYAVAPDFQKKIPFIIWISEEMKSRLGEPKTLPRYGHDNVFHTVIGAFGLETPAYDPASDIFAHRQSADTAPGTAEQR